jgi:nucleotide-binding universal stress UspA family protein
VAPSVHSYVIECDHIGDGIVKFSEEQDCDLVVMGNTSRSKLGRWLLGSVSRYVLRHAPCSVWITRNRTIRGNVAQGHRTASELV